MISRQFAAPKLAATIQTAVIITAEQGAVTQWRRKIIQHLTFEGNNGLQHDFRSDARQSLNTAKNGSQ